MENSFWNINGDTGTNFLKGFKKSFTLYVDSGMKEKTERGIEVLRNDQGEFSPHWQPEARDLEEKFHKFVSAHYLRKFLCFYSFDTSNHSLRLLNAAHPESQASATVGRKIKELFTWFHAKIM